MIARASFLTPCGGWQQTGSEDVSHDDFKTILRPAWIRPKLPQSGLGSYFRDSLYSDILSP